jgi:hypothetical protein
MPDLSRSGSPDRHFSLNPDVGAARACDHRAGKGLCIAIFGVMLGYLTVAVMIG